MGMLASEVCLRLRRATRCPSAMHSRRTCRRQERALLLACLAVRRPSVCKQRQAAALLGTSTGMLAALVVCLCQPDRLAMRPRYARRLCIPDRRLRNGRARCLACRLACRMAARQCKKVRGGVTPPDHPFNTLLRAWGDPFRGLINIHHQCLVDRTTQKVAAHLELSSACDLSGVVAEV